MDKIWGVSVCPYAWKEKNQNRAKNVINWVKWDIQWRCPCKILTTIWYRKLSIHVEQFFLFVWWNYMNGKYKKTKLVDLISFFSHFKVLWSSILFKFVKMFAVLFNFIFNNNSPGSTVLFTIGMEVFKSSWATL